MLVLDGKRINRAFLSPTASGTMAFALEADVSLEMTRWSRSYGMSLLLTFC